MKSYCLEHAVVACAACSLSVFRLQACSSCTRHWKGWDRPVGAGMGCGSGGWFLPNPSVGSLSRHSNQLGVPTSHDAALSCFQGDEGGPLPAPRQWGSLVLGARRQGRCSSGRNQAEADRGRHAVGGARQRQAAAAAAAGRKAGGVSPCSLGSRRCSGILMLSCTRLQERWRAAPYPRRQRRALEKWAPVTAAAQVGLGMCGTPKVLPSSHPMQTCCGGHAATQRLRYSLTVPTRLLLCRGRYSPRGARFRPRGAPVRRR